MTSHSISFAGYTFDDDKGCFTCQHVLDGAPVLLFVHEADGDLQFMCGAPDHDYDECRLLHAAHLLDAQPDLLMLPTVDFGFEAERPDVRSPWVVSPIPQYDSPSPPLAGIAAPSGNRSMRGANVTAAIAVALWFGWALLGRDVIHGIVARQPAASPNMGQIDAFIMWPLYVVVALLTCAWACNCFRRWDGALAVLSAIAIAAFLPYLALSGGGV